MKTHEKIFSRALFFSSARRDSLFKNISSQSIRDLFRLCVVVRLHIYHHLNNHTTKKSFVDLHHHLRKTVGVGGRVRFEILLRT